MKAYYNENDSFPAQWLRNLIDAGHLPAGDVDERSIADLEPQDCMPISHFFAGIGGWPLALRLAGWPDDRPVWTGSCPCQPFSVAGKRGGTDDSRHLWPEWFRLIRECRPPVIFGEQVASRGALAWLDIVQSQLESCGYAVGAISIPACGFGAPHIRQRLYFVADRYGSRCGTWRSSKTSDGGGAPWIKSTGFCATNGFWADAEWLACADGKARPTQPKYVKVPDGFPGGLGLVCTKDTEEDKISADAKETGSDYKLPDVWKSDAASEIQRSPGIKSCFQSSEVLQSRLHGGRLQREDQDSKPEEQSAAVSQNGGRLVPNMRSARQPTLCSSSGSQSNEQFSVEFEDFVRLLPSSIALAELHGDAATTEAMFALLTPDCQERIVQYAPYSFQEIWRSIDSESQDRLKVGFETGDFVRTIEHPLVTDAQSRVGRLRAYGNAIVPQVAAEFIRAYLAS